MVGGAWWAVVAGVVARIVLFVEVVSGEIGRRFWWATLHS